MHHPTAEQVEQVAKRFERVADTYIGEVRMLETHVLRKGACGTVACHAGWYMVAKGEEAGTLGEWREGEVSGVYLKDRDPERGWHVGAEEMARDLGFECLPELPGWAHAHPHLWGNAWGEKMFNNACAFTGEGDPEVPGGTLSLRDVAEHWRAVARRVAGNEAATARGTC